MGATHGYDLTEPRPLDGDQEEHMPDPSDRKHVDHPAPGIGLIILFLLSIGVLIAAIPSTLPDSPGVLSPRVLLTGPGFLFVLLAIFCFYFWPLYTTYYTVSSVGLHVRYGPWKRLYPWSDFTAAYWQRGLFVTRIGWPSVTPCVRLANGVLLHRRRRGLGLYLTPNDPRAFIRRIGEFAPTLTAETVI
jgi:hypothetical protein